MARFGVEKAVSEGRGVAISKTRRRKTRPSGGKLAGDLEQDNLMFQKNRISSHDSQFETVYVNGSNNLPNLKLAGEIWKFRLIEEEFMKRMWHMEGV